MGQQWNDINRRLLGSFEGSGDYVFYDLLSNSVIEEPREYRAEELLSRARAGLRAFPGSIVGYIDIPVTLMVPILCRELGLPSASLEAVLKCQHKYWSRLQRGIANVNGSFYYLAVPQSLVRASGWRLQPQDHGGMWLARGPRPKPIRDPRPRDCLHNKLRLTKRNKLNMIQHNKLIWAQHKKLRLEQNNGRAL